MNELIKLNPVNLNGQEVNTVNARELHEFLEVGRRFNTWIKNRIEQYDFVENQDFVCVSQNRETHRNDGQVGATVVKDYYITLDVAKELSMVERNDKGREARRYFIECERQLLEQAKQLTITPKERFQLNIIAADTETNRLIALNEYEIGYVKPLENKVEELTPKGEFYDAVTQSESHLDLGMAAKTLNFKGLGRNNLFKLLRDWKILNHKNIPYQQYLTSGYFKLVETSWLNPKTQELQVSVKPVLYQKGLDWLDKKLKEAGYEYS